MITPNRPVEDWAKLLGDTAAIAAMLDRLLHDARPQVWAAELADEGSAQLFQNLPTSVGPRRVAETTPARGGLLVGCCIEVS